MRSDLPTPGPRRQAARRRRAQVRRRRALALAVLAVLAALSAWAAFAVSRPAPARVPPAAAAPTVLASPSGDDLVPIAEVAGVDVLLPVPREVSTAVAFRPSDVPDAVSLTPVGRQAGGGDLGKRLADVLAGGEVAYSLLDGADDGSCDVLEVGAVPGSPIMSPVDGEVVALQRYRLLGRYPDVELRIQCADDPSLVVVVSHLRRPRVAVGEPVAAGGTALGEVRGFPASLQQALGRLTSDAGDHVQLMVLRVKTGLTEL